MIAVGTNDRFGEASRLIAVGPVKRGLENNLLRWIALRLVESCRGLGLAKDVGNTVIADAVARAEVGMRVVVERAPADPARILRIGCQLIVDPRMTQGVLALPFVVIGCLRREGMAHEFRVEIARMVRLLER